MFKNMLIFKVVISLTATVRAVCIVHRPLLLRLSCCFLNESQRKIGIPANIHIDDFPDENLTLKHDSYGVISMANKGKDTNTSQFFITLVPMPWLDGRHVIFGRVVEDDDHVIRTISNTPVDNKYRPVESVVITECGVNQQRSSNLEPF